MASVTIRDNTQNQATYDYLISKLLLGKYTTRRVNYANITGALETLAIGTVMGRVDATGKLVQCISTADDGSQEPIGILMEPLTGIAIAAEVDQVLIVDGGVINESGLIFNGADNLATVITTTGGNVKSIKDLLIQNGNGFEFLAVNDGSSYDN